jgi:hypothetical protein
MATMTPVRTKWQEFCSSTAHESVHKASVLATTNDSLVMALLGPVPHRDLALQDNDMHELRAFVEEATLQKDTSTQHLLYIGLAVLWDANPNMNH